MSFIGYHCGGATVLCLVAQSFLTLCDPMACSPPASSVHGDSPGKNTGMGCHALLQRIFATQGSNRGLPHCRQILHHLSHQGSPSGRLHIYILFRMICTLKIFQNLHSFCYFVRQKVSDAFCGFLKSLKLLDSTLCIEGKKELSLI